MFLSDQESERMLYLASINVMKKWTQRHKNWDRLLNQLVIMFEGQLEQYL